MKEEIEDAIGKFWGTRGTQGGTQAAQHLNAFCALMCRIIIEAGIQPDEVRFGSRVEIPGYYRPTKKWDILVVRRNRLCAAIEMKSQCGSFGNNYNNRTEEALGSSADVWKAYEKELLGNHTPWLGYFFLLEKSPESLSPVRIAPTPFPVDRVFEGASYAKRYQLLCDRMVKERHYNAATFITSARDSTGAFEEPNADLRFIDFARALWGHLLGC
jgi:hypothetical protein